MAFDKLLEALCAYSKRMNRPARELVIPTVWEDQGLFRVTCKGREVRLENPRVGEAKVLQESALQQQWDGSPLSVTENWSPWTAAVVCASVPGLRVACLKYFPDEAVRCFAD
eukprot:1401080-Amphidinium_carterae.1